MKTHQNKSNSNQLTDDSCSAVSPWWVLGVIVVLAGQLLISAGEAVLPQWHLFVGVIIAVIGSILFVWLSRGSAKTFLGQQPDRPLPYDVMFVVVPVLMLVIASGLNYWKVKTGFAEDEFGEFYHLTLPIFERGWTWWTGNDEPLTANLSAIVCHIFGLRYETFKITAFLLRTAAGLFTWLIAVELFGKRIGLWCAFIVATSVMYMCSFNTVIKELSSHMTYLGCTYFTLRGLRLRSWHNMIIGGLFAGLASYTYISRFALFAFLGVWAVFAYFSRDKIYSLGGVGKLGLLAWFVSFIIVSLPSIYYSIFYPESTFFVAAIRTHSSVVKGGLFTLVKDTFQEFLAIVFRGDPWATSDFAQHPMLWFPWAVLFWMGFVMMLWRVMEIRMFVPLLLMMAFVGVAGVYVSYTPNWKYSRTAMLLSSIPVAVAVDFVASLLRRGSGKAFLQWAPLVIVFFSFDYGWKCLQEVVSEPSDWWFRAVAPMRPREDYVFANKQCRLWGVGFFVTDARPGGPVSPVRSIREVLETPSDGRDVIFLFPAGRAEWGQKISSLVKTYQSIYPGGHAECHTVPVRGGNWPVFVSYRVPADRYWHLPRVDHALSNEAQSTLLWQRAGILKEHGLLLEAWRDALKAAQLDPKYYLLADQLLGNDKGQKGRLAVLIQARLWEEAREQLIHLRATSQLSKEEERWLAFLELHGLNMEVFSTYTATDKPLTTVREYFADVPVGFGAWYMGAPTIQFSARATGRLFVPREGYYQFDMRTILVPRKITIDGKPVLEISRYRYDSTPSERVFLSQGMHELVVENCVLYHFDGKIPVPTCIPDPLNYLYGADDMYWSLKWMPEGATSFVLIPPQYLYAPGANYTPDPPSL